MTESTNTDTIKILLFGGKGWIGGMIRDLCKEKNIQITEGKSRVDDYATIKEELERVKPTHIISTIGRTHGKIGDTTIPTIDYLEHPGKLVENVRDNLYGPYILARVTEKLGIHFTYLGTGCIFSYTDTQSIFTEENKPNFTGSAYSTVKGFTDQMMKTFDNVLNVRIRMPITAEENSRDFITKLLGYKKICSISNSMTVLDDLLPVMLDMVTSNKTGTINLVNPGVISHNKILSLYKQIVDPQFEWENFDYDEQMKVIKSHRSNNELSTSKLTEQYPDVPDIYTSVRNVMVKKYKNKIATQFIKS
jgi:dTDP-4-dehydrorhamnose reductase